MKIERGRLRGGLSIGIVYTRKVHNDFYNKDYSQIIISFIAYYVCISWAKTNKKLYKTKKRSLK